MNQPAHSDSPHAPDQDIVLPDWLSVHQTAALLQMPRGNLITLLKKGEMDSERQSGRLVIRAAAYQTFRDARVEAQTQALDKLAVLDSVLL
ncbi:MAG: hypothetical protein AB8B96_16110 [Lysobacterales bacterium]